MIKEKLEKTIEEAVISLQEKGKLSKFSLPDVIIEIPSQEAHGDYSCNIALQVAKLAKKKPLETAELIKEEISSQKKDFLKRIEVVNGFINFFLSEGFLQEITEKVLKEDFGSLNLGKGEKVNLEFISANPTGPLTLANGRGGFCGDVLANVLEKSGFKVSREYYLNDKGVQVKALGHSVLGDSEAVYKGEYIKELREKIKEKDPEKAGEKASEYIVKNMIKPTVEKMGIKFDTWFSEKDLYPKETEKVLKKLKDLTFEKEGALWLRTTKFGDDKDRVLVKEDGEPTYFLSDIAYLENKFKRGFRKLIVFLGADHHGYIGRLKSATEALGYLKEQTEFIVFQMVRLFSEGKQMRMSKREGVYVALDELIEEVGLDVARFFFLEREANTHLNFNLDLAKERSEKNPVYYVQYAHARTSGILEKASKKKGDLSLLTHPSEMALMKEIARFSDVVKDTAKDRQLQRIPQYSRDLASSFHKFYKDCKVLEEKEDLSRARLALVEASKIALKNSLEIMGVSAPDKM